MSQGRGGQRGGSKNELHSTAPTCSFIPCSSPPAFATNLLNPLFILHLILIHLDHPIISVCSGSKPLQSKSELNANFRALFGIMNCRHRIHNFDEQCHPVFFLVAPPYPRLLHRTRKPSVCCASLVLRRFLFHAFNRRIHVAFVTMKCTSGFHARASSGCFLTFHRLTLLRTDQCSTDPNASWILVDKVKQ